MIDDSNRQRLRAFSSVYGRKAADAVLGRAKDLAGGASITAQHIGTAAQEYVDEHLHRQQPLSVSGSANVITAEPLPIPDDI